MPKELIHVGLAVTTDGFQPRMNNILNISAHTKNHELSVNIIPQNGVYTLSKFWQKYPEAFELLKDDAVPLKEGIKLLQVWLTKFQGKYIAVTAMSDFWHLIEACKDLHLKWMFSYQCLDVATYMLDRSSVPNPRKPSLNPLPKDLARIRYMMVRNKCMDLG